MSHPLTLKSIEEHIDFLHSCIGMGYANIVQTVPNPDFKKDLQNINYEYFILYADQHYFISRVLFMNFILEYSLFSGQQCVENYLKAYIKYKRQTPCLTHDLFSLLTDCKKLSTPEEKFISSERIYTICYRYNPFNEIPRYPVAREEWSGHAIMHPLDIYPLDYFVLKMREAIPYPSGQADILKGQTTFLHLCRENAPGFYQTFFDDNINFILTK